LYSGKRLGTAEEAASRVIGLLPEKGEQYRVCESHRLLGHIYRSTGETEKAIHHNKVALRIASSFDWHDDLVWVHYNLAGLFLDEGRFDDAQAHIDHVKSHAVNGAFYLGRAMWLQAMVWHEQHRLEEAMSEALRAVEILEKLGATEAVECREFLSTTHTKAIERPGYF